MGLSCPGLIIIIHTFTSMKYIKLIKQFLYISVGSVKYIYNKLLYTIVVYNIIVYKSKKRNAQTTNDLKVY